MLLQIYEPGPIDLGKIRKKMTKFCPFKQPALLTLGRKLKIWVVYKKLEKTEPSFLCRWEKKIKSCQNGAVKTDVWLKS